MIALSEKTSANRRRGSTSLGLSWAQFERAAPTLASPCRELFERWGFVFAGTIRADGTPRISPVEVHIVNGHLMLVMITNTHKVRDLRRDLRITLQTPVTDPARPAAEVKLRGSALRVTDAEQRGITADAIQTTSGWRPASSWSYFSLRITAAAHLTWVNGDLVLARWDRDHGLRGIQQRRLDVEAATYREP